MSNATRRYSPVTERLHPRARPVPQPLNSKNKGEVVLNAPPQKGHAVTPAQHAVDRINTIWPTPRMSRLTRLEYASALDPYHPDAIAAAINQVRDSWLKDFVPPPGAFIEAAQAAQAEHARTHPRGPDGVGVGCPHCRQAGVRGDWYGDGWIVMCATHNTGWRGRLQAEEAA